MCASTQRTSSQELITMIFGAERPLMRRAQVWLVREPDEAG